MSSPKTFEAQTECVINCLLEDFLNPTSITNRTLIYECETDAGADSSFDVAIIAGRLRMIGDQYNKEVEASAQEFITEFRRGQVKFLFLSIAEAVLQHTVKSLSQALCAQDSTLACEKAQLGVLVKLTECVAKKAPELVSQLVTAMTRMINGNEIRGFIQSQGGWVSMLGAWLC
ncbi:Bcl-2-like protein 15 [Galemys pyrenaicus]|uniref:Bcl-2-like protein 15 n=1 Tax=Galemys pyrenaicus TaxID=202257 RepID=A0A8J6ADX6_GALPY|nr:Bcl-2-like protein 15 [Galemys pyrenaicus]